VLSGLNLLSVHYVSSAHKKDWGSIMLLPVLQPQVLLDVVVLLWRALDLRQMGWYLQLIGFL
jgi:hypothetical protein